MLRYQYVMEALSELNCQQLHGFPRLKAKNPICSEGSSLQKPQS